MKRFAGLAALVLACGAPAPLDFSGPTAAWPEYGGDKGGRRWSPVDQIDAHNVGELQVAWVHHNGDISDGSDGSTRTALNVTPIVVDDSLYFCTPFNRVIARDAETGEERWAFDPGQRMKKIDGPYNRVCRGVAYWESDAPDAGGVCSTRILTGTLDSELIALDARSGAVCPDFGENGRVALREGLRDAPDWEYYPTSPPLVLNDVVVIGALVADNLRVDAPSGVVRGFDVRSGALRWAWDPVPPGWKTPRAIEGGPRYAAGTPNVWSILSGDAERGLVFVPTGNASPDYSSGDRHGLDYYSSSTVALDADTGEVRWRFQTVHNDIWDYDVPSQPALTEIQVGGATVPVVVQTTKMGLVFVLHRETGEPVFEVVERPVPARDVPGETVTPTQPFPTHIPSLHPHELTPDDAWGFTRWDRDDCAAQIASLRSEGLYTPVSFQGSIQFPNSGGGPNWGSVAIDPSGVMYVNSFRMPAMIKLLTREQYDALDKSQFGYPNEVYPMEGTPYAIQRAPLFSPLGAPCNKPPWGVLTAIDLNAGEILWEVPLGSTRDQAPFPMWLDFGSPNIGGPVATGGGVVFIGATTDKFLRAFDAETGEVLWKQRIPFTANATPLTYRVSPEGRQYVVVAAGGHGWSEPGDAIIAFALPTP